MKRKITSLLMALVMTLSLAAPAFATDTPWNTLDGDASADLSQTITIKATTAVPTIALTLPTMADANNIILNPYGITLEAEAYNTVNGVEMTASSTFNGKQVISPIFAIKNESDVMLKFSVKATSSVAGQLTLATADVNRETEKKNTAYVTLQVATNQSAAPNAVGTSNNAMPTALVTTGTGQNGVVLKTGDVTLSGLTQPAATFNNGTATPNYIWFQYGGSAASNPDKAWTADDKLTSTLVFTFNPGLSGPTTTLNPTAISIANTVTKADVTAPSDIDLADDTTMGGTGKGLNSTNGNIAATPAFTVSPAITGVSVDAAGKISITAAGAVAALGLTDAQSSDKPTAGDHTLPITVTYKTADSMTGTVIVNVKWTVAS